MGACVCLARANTAQGLPSPHKLGKFPVHRPSTLHGLPVVEAIRPVVKPIRPVGHAITGEAVLKGSARRLRRRFAKPPPRQLERGSEGGRYLICTHTHWPVGRDHIIIKHKEVCTATRARAPLVSARMQASVRMQASARMQARGVRRRADEEGRAHQS